MPDDRDYTERARELLKHFSHDWDMEAGIKKIAAALSAVASEHQAEIEGLRGELGNRNRETLALTCEIDALKHDIERHLECLSAAHLETAEALAKLARLREPGVLDEITTNLSDRLGISYAQWAAQRAIAVITEKLT